MMSFLRRLLEHGPEAATSLPPQASSPSPPAGAESSGPAEASLSSSAVTETDLALPPSQPGGGSPTSVAAVQAHLATARELFAAERFAAAMEEILAVLDVYPKNAEAMELAENVLSLGLHAHAKEVIPPRLSLDPLLDGLFNQCEQCHDCWPFNPVYRGEGHIAVMNPAGGRCPSCGKVWCRKCARAGMTLACPKCGAGLEILRAPSGRRRGLGPAKHPGLRLLAAFVFKEPPAPRNERSYLTIVLDTLCPEVFHAPSVKPRLFFEIGPEATDEDGALAYSVARCMVQGIEIHEESIFLERFTSSDGDRGMLVTFYAPK